MDLKFLHRAFFGNEIQSYLIAVAVLAVGVVFLRVVQYVIFRSIERWSARTSTRLDDFFVSSLRKALLPLLYFAVVYFSLRSLSLNPSLSKAITAFGTVLVTFVAIRFITQAFQFVVFNLWLSKRSDGPTIERQFKALMPIFTMLVWSLGGIFLLDNLGFKISTLVAGLGIGGVALALASQTVLGDMFSYFAIMLDRPFELDDFIIMGDYMGSVEHIGIKTTRLRSLGGEQLVFSNKDLTDSRIRNYKRMQIRRVVFKIGVTYDTPAEKLRKASEILKESVTSTHDTRFDRAHFFSFEDSSLLFEVVYYVQSADYNIYMDIQQDINLKIMSAFAKEAIDFAFPTRQIIVTPPQAVKEFLPVDSRPSPTRI